MTAPISAPVRGTQSVVDQMGWIFSRPRLTLIELAWRWTFGIPLLYVCWLQLQQILAAMSPGVGRRERHQHAEPLEGQCPVGACLVRLPAARLRCPPLARTRRRRGLGDLRPRPEVCSSVWLTSQARRSDSVPLAMMVQQAGWMALFGAACWGWFRSMAWVAATHITKGQEPDLIGFAAWTIFLSLGFFTLWALVSWTFSIAPLVMLGENRSALSSIVASFHLGREFTGKLIEINLVMGIVNLALVVLAMVLSAAPLPFSDELGPEALHRVAALAVLFYLVSSDYFQVVRLKGFHEFLKTYRGCQSAG